MCKSIQEKHSTNELELRLRRISSALKLEKTKFSTDDFLASRRKNGQSKTIHEAWREKIVSWCYDVSVILCIDLNVIYDAMSILDRYLAQASPHLINDMVVQCTSLAALYLAIQRNTNIIFPLEALLKLKRGKVQKDTVSKIIKHMSQILYWYKSPSPSEFVSLIVGCLPLSVSEEEKILIQQTSICFAELSTYSSFFSGIYPSQIAIACVQTTLHTLNYGTDIVFIEKMIESATGPHDNMAMNKILVDLFNKTWDGLHAKNIQFNVINSRNGTQQQMPRIVSNDDLTDL